MARGHQKLQSQQKNAKKQAEIKKIKGHDQKAFSVHMHCVSDTNA